MKKFVTLITIFTFLFSTMMYQVANAQIQEALNLDHVEQIENYVIETYSGEVNEENIFKKTGYKQVNSITEINKTSKYITTEVKIIEDYYDLNGTFLESIISIEEYHNNYFTGKAKVRSNKESINIPSTIYGKKNIPTPNAKMVKYNGNLAEEESIKKNIESIASDMAISDFRDVKGYSFNELEEISNTIKNLSPMSNFNCGIVECAGAYDNYYNHNISNGDFIIQALSSTKGKYIKYTGSTFGSTKNATSVANFKRYIDNYEDYLIDQMEYSQWETTFTWLPTIVGFVLFAAGIVAGPGGWVALVNTWTIAEGLTLFASLTGTTYAVVGNYQASKNAMQNLENARSAMYYSNYENITMEVVNGYY